MIRKELRGHRMVMPTANRKRSSKRRYVQSYTNPTTHPRPLPQTKVKLLRLVVFTKKASIKAQKSVTAFNKGARENAPV